MRVLSKNVKNEMTFLDPVSGSELTIYYRLPTPTERVRYSNEIFSRTNGKIVQRPIVRLKYGGEILEGIGENQFCDEDGKPISSNENDKNYNPNWKKLVIENVEEILMHLAYKVFEGLSEKKTDDAGPEIEIEIKEGELKQRPFDEN